MPQTTSRATNILPGRSNIGERRLTKSAGVDQHSTCYRLTVHIWSISIEPGAHRDTAFISQGALYQPQLPAAGCSQGNPPWPGSTNMTADHKQPGVEHRLGITLLDVFEECCIDRPGAVIQGQEDHPFTGSNRRCLSSDLHTGNQHLLLGATTQQILRSHDAKTLENLGIELHDMVTDIHAKNVQFSANTFSIAEFGEPGWHLRKLGIDIQRQTELITVPGIPVAIQVGDL